MCEYGKSPSPLYGKRSDDKTLKRFLAFTLTAEQVRELLAKDYGLEPLQGSWLVTKN